MRASFLAILFLQKFHVLALVVFIASVLAKASFDTSIQEALSRIVGGRVATVLLFWSIFTIFRIYKDWSTVTSPQRPQIRRTVATLPPTILLKTSWNEVSREAFARTGAIKTNTNIEALWLLLKGLSWHLYIRGEELRPPFLFAVLQLLFNLWICNFTKGLSWHLSISGARWWWEELWLSFLSAVF